MSAFCHCHRRADCPPKRRPWPPCGPSVATFRNVNCGSPVPWFIFNSFYVVLNSFWWILVLYLMNFGNISSIRLTVLCRGGEAIPEDLQCKDLYASASLILWICAICTSHAVLLILSQLSPGMMLGPKEGDPCLYQNSCLHTKTNCRLIHGKSVLGEQIQCRPLTSNTDD